MKKPGRDYWRHWAQERHVRFRRFLDAYKMLVGCARCGYHGHPRGLDFHHLRDKKFLIGRRNQMSSKKLLAEVMKCEVLCAICHRIEHA